MILDARAYGPDATAAERAAIEARVSWLEDGVMLFRELPVMAPFTVDLMFDQVEAMAAGLPRFDTIVDLTESERPSAEVREEVRRRASALRNLGTLAVVTGRNVFVNVALRFVLGGIAPRFSVHATLDDARRAIARARSGSGAT